jgi:hypothetical protein
MTHGLPYCERDTFTEEQVTGFLKEDGERIQHLESLERRLQVLSARWVIEALQRSLSSKHKLPWEKNASRAQAPRP